MQKEFYYDDKPYCGMWDSMWTSRTIEQELKDCDMESPARTMFLSCLTRQDKIIEAGCGFGKWVIYLHRLGYDITGIDNNEFAISKLKEYDGTLKVEMGNILNTRYPDNHFDAYISMGVVEHFEEGPQAVLKEAYRILKPGGAAFVSVPTVNGIRKFYRPSIRRAVHKFLVSAAMIKRGWSKSKFGIVSPALVNLLPEKMRMHIKGTGERYYHFSEYRYTGSELETFLKQAGFEIIETLPHDFYDSEDHAIGLSLDFPFLKDLNAESYFKLNPIGKAISRLLDNKSPWIACSSVFCMARSLKKG